MPQVVPSGERKVFTWFSVVGCESADGLGDQRLASRIAGVDLVPESDFGFTLPPAEKDRPAAHGAREIDQSDSRILHLDAERGELAAESFDFASDGLHFGGKAFGDFSIR